MNHRLALRRLLYAGLPAATLVVVVVSTIWGPSGLVHRKELTGELEVANAHLASVERDNQRLLREITVLQRDPVAMERLVAEELAESRDGTVLYRFDPPADRVGKPAPGQ